MRYEYRIVPAPEKGEKLKGASAEARFAAAVERVLNDMAARGWELQPSAMMIEGLIDASVIHDEDIQGEIATFARGELMVHVHVYDAEGGRGSAVSIFKSR